MPVSYGQFTHARFLGMPCPVKVFPPWLKSMEAHCGPNKGTTTQVKQLAPVVVMRHVKRYETLGLLWWGKVKVVPGELRGLVMSKLLLEVPKLVEIDMAALLLAWVVKEKLVICEVCRLSSTGTV